METLQEIVHVLLVSLYLGGVALFLLATRQVRLRLGNPLAALRWLRRALSGAPSSSA